MISSKFKTGNVWRFGENDQFKPKHYNLPFGMTFPQAGLKQIGLRYAHLCA